MTDLSTKVRIIEGAEDLLLNKSLESVSLNEILKATETAKGCFYHHFNSKEHFGEELIKHYTEKTVYNYTEILSNREIEPDARQRVIAHFELKICRFIENNGQCPCLLIKLASESSFSSPALRLQISAAYSRINALYEEVIEEAQQNGQISTSRSAKLTTQMMNSLWIGAVTQALSHQKTDLLRSAVDFIAEAILVSPVTENILQTTTV